MARLAKSRPQSEHQVISWAKPLPEQDLHLCKWMDCAASRQAQRPSKAVLQSHMCATCCVSFCRARHRVPLLGGLRPKAFLAPQRPQRP